MRWRGWLFTCMGQDADVDFFGLRRDDNFATSQYDGRRRAAMNSIIWATGPNMYGSKSTAPAEIGVHIANVGASYVRAVRFFRC